MDASDNVIDNTTGIVRWVSEIPLEPGEPEIFNFSVKMCDSSRFFPLGCYDRNGGAGLTPEEAYRAAVGEAIERYCSSAFWPDQLLLGSYDEVQQQGRALGPDDIALFHPEQKSTIRYPWFTRDRRIAWTRGYSLTRREAILVPACLTYVPYAPFLREQGEETIGPSITTGQACAFSYRDAALRGIYEIVERDAFMITWMNRLPVPRIDPESSPAVGKIFRERFARPNLRYLLYSMATDLGIPSVLCVVIDEQRDPPMICTGGASNLDPERAAVKSLVEAAQTREWAKFMGYEKKPVIIESDYSNLDEFDKHVRLYAYGNMLPAIEFLLRSEPQLSLRDLEPKLPAAADDLRRVADAIESQGYEILMVDLTTPDVWDCGYRAVKMMIPQLQQLEGDHTHRLLGGRRLYEVPGRIGYDVACSFSSLNPDPHPYP